MTEQTTMAITHHEDEGEEYLTFRLGDENYGVDILRVQEIRGWEPVTRVPNAPAFVQGVLNLRGAIVPVVDLRQRLGMPLRDYDKETVVVVVRLDAGEAEKIIGLVVDTVSDVLRATTDAISKTPDFGARLNTDFLVGVATSGDKMIMLLDVDRLHNSEATSDETEAGAA